ncbi:MAG: Kae1-associated kinase Bud32 [Thermoproteota archaeon]|nr:MAG: Kae1-associated kinase Bud32 [Candidatus Korarchaeota archaeon]
MERLISEGAEASVYEDRLLGLRVIRKVRRAKRYRHPELDRRLRSSRTKMEASILLRARGAGVPCPAVLDVRGYVLTIEEVEGETLMSFLRRSDPQGALSVGVKLGEAVGRLHSAGVAHNDLTPVNVMVSSGDVRLIDFGLARFTRDVEDFAVDLHVLLKSVEALCPSPEFSRGVLEGYSRTFPRWREVLSRVEDIGRRGRYR